MSGREERNESIKNKIEKLIKWRPKHLKEFYMTLNDVLPMTQFNYLNAVINFIDYAIKEWDIDPWFPQQFSKITPARIQQYFFDMKTGISTKNKHHAALKRYFAFLEVNEYISKDPMLKVKRLGTPKVNEAVSLTPEEIEIIFNNLKHPELIIEGAYSRTINQRQRFMNRNLAMISVALSNGLRSSSLIAIDINDVDLEARLIKVIQKGDREHTVYLSENTIYYLKKWLKERNQILINNGVDSDALFLNANGTRISYDGFEKVVEWASTGINKKITSHKLRSTCATNIYDATKDLNLTAKVLGHSDVNTTRRYIHVDPEKERSAIENLDKIFK